MNSTIQFRRTRQMFLFLPLLVVPLMTGIFWGWRKHTATSQAQRQGLNTSLPGAQFDKHAASPDKMSLYQQAARDSGRKALKQAGTLLQMSNQHKALTGTLSGAGSENPDVKRISLKLAQISSQVNQPQPANTQPYTGNGGPSEKSFSKQVNKLDEMMRTMNSSQSTDPQMQQLSAMLGQIQAIQNPELAKMKIKPEETRTDTPFRAISAVVDGNQKILQGGVVRLMTTDTVQLKGVLLTKGQLLFGACNITNQRLMLEIKNIRRGHSIIPVNLTVFGLDGLPGIPAPEAELSGAAAEGTSNALQDMQLLSMDQSMATQAASAGISAAKGLLNKKVRHLKVKLKNGYPILLRNNNQH